MQRDDAGGRWISRYSNPAGSLTAEDEALWSGGEFQRYSYVRHAIGESSSVERHGPKLIYTRVLDGRKDQAEEEYSDDFAVGPTVILHILRNWKPLMSGEQLEIRYGVLDRLRSYGFELSRDAEHPRNSPRALVVRMRPSSAFVRLFVDPVYLVFSRDGQILRELIGRMLPMERDGNGLRAIDGDLVIQTEGFRKARATP